MNGKIIVISRNFERFNDLTIKRLSDQAIKRLSAKSFCAFRFSRWSVFIKPRAEDGKLSIYFTERKTVLNRTSTLDCNQFGILVIVFFRFALIKSANSLKIFIF